MGGQGGRRSEPANQGGAVEGESSEPFRELGGGAGGRSSKLGGGARGRSSEPEGGAAG